MTIGAVWAFWTYFAFVVEPISIFKTFSRVILESAITIDSVLEYFKEAKKVKEFYKDSTLDMKNSEKIITIRNLSFAQNNNLILKDVTFLIKKVIW
ncbi:ABC transporter ATP-binding protein [Anoxybacter fermentans]|uniref:ABC transporter ATP-binding protein n=1 Tax=Anoxybacter fermentans TaxID=1323375 RepID=UPI000F8D3CBF|nr:ABC transporter ATP-binding protein [Anoxybacter fermentans]